MLNSLSLGGVPSLLRSPDEPNRAVMAGAWAEIAALPVCRSIPG